MGNEDYHEAKLIYDLLSRAGFKPEEDIVAKLGALLGLRTGAQDLLNRVERLTQGLPAEDEFMALAAWTGSCRLIHKLEQDQFPRASRQRLQVPDLLAVFTDGQQEVPALIEVKATNDKVLPQARLRFTAHAHAKLRSYADVLRLPLLIAWRVRGYWTLFDFNVIPSLKTAYALSGEDAMRADLTYLLLGNLHFVPMQGLRLTLALKDEGLIREEESDQEIRRMRFTGLRFEDAQGRRIDELSWPQFILWMSAAHDEVQTKTDDGFEIAFQVPNEPPGIPAYALLSLLLYGLRNEERRPVNWWQAMNDERFDTVPYSAIVEAADMSIGTIIRYILKIVPQKVPDFLPTGWARLPSRP